MKPTILMRITNTQLNELIEWFKVYKPHGLIDPWVLSDGTTIDPSAVLWELRAFRNLYPNGPKHWETAN